MSELKWVYPDVMIAPTKHEVLLTPPEDGGTALWQTWNDNVRLFLEVERENHLQTFKMDDDALNFLSAKRLMVDAYEWMDGLELITNNTSGLSLLPKMILRDKLMPSIWVTEMSEYLLESLYSYPTDITDKIEKTIEGVTISHRPNEHYLAGWSPLIGDFEICMRGDSTGYFKIPEGEVHNIRCFGGISLSDFRTFVMPALTNHGDVCNSDGYYGIAQRTKPTKDGDYVRYSIIDLLAFVKRMLTDMFGEPFDAVIFRPNTMEQKYEDQVDLLLDDYKDKKVLVLYYHGGLDVDDWDSKSMSSIHPDKAWLADKVLSCLSQSPSTNYNYIDDYVTKAYTKDFNPASGNIGVVYESGYIDSNGHYHVTQLLPAGVRYMVECLTFTSYTDLRALTRLDDSAIVERLSPIHDAPVLYYRKDAPYVDRLSNMMWFEIEKPKMFDFEEVQEKLQAELEAKLANANTTEQRLLNEIESYRKSIVQRSSEYREHLQIVAELRKNPEEGIRQRMAAYDMVKEIPDLLAAVYVDGVLKCRTGRITGVVPLQNNKVTKRDFGQFDFTISDVGALHFTQLIESCKRKSYWSDKDLHPHISGGSGRGCLGNLEELVATGVANNDPFTAVYAIMEYLKTANVDDAAGAYYYYWDEVDEEGNIIPASEAPGRMFCPNCNAKYNDPEASEDIVGEYDEDEAEVNLHYCDKCNKQGCSDCMNFNTHGYGTICNDCRDSMWWCEYCGGYHDSGIDRYECDATGVALCDKALSYYNEPGGFTVYFVNEQARNEYMISRNLVRCENCYDLYDEDAHITCPSCSGELLNSDGEVVTASDGDGDGDGDDDDDDDDTTFDDALEADIAENPDTFIVEEAPYDDVLDAIRYAGFREENPNNANIPEIVGGFYRDLPTAPPTDVPVILERIEEEE